MRYFPLFILPYNLCITFDMLFQCLSFVDTYYTHIYEFLTNELNGKKLCGIVGICPNSIKSIQDINNFAVSK